MSNETADLDIEDFPEHDEITEDDENVLSDTEDKDFEDGLEYDKDVEMGESDFIQLLIKEMTRQHSVYATYYSAHIQKIGIILAFATIGLIQILFFILGEYPPFQEYSYFELAILSMSALLILIPCFLGLYAVLDDRLGSPSPGSYLFKIYDEANESGKYLDAYDTIINEEFSALDDLVGICIDLQSLSKIMAILLTMGIVTLLVFVGLVII